MPIDKSNQVHFETRAEWRRWLRLNHKLSRGVWLVYFKKHTKKETVSYNDAVEEALCFGWIDSTVKRIDDDRYIQQFTPRRNSDNWSEANKSRIRKLIARGKVTKAGLAKIDLKILDVSPKPKLISKEVIVPKFIEAAFKKNKIAWNNFQNLAPSHRRLYVHWISEAKREETRERRIAFAVSLLLENKRLSTG